MYILNRISATRLFVQRRLRLLLLMDFFERDFVGVSVILVVIAAVDGRDDDGVLSPTV